MLRKFLFLQIALLALAMQGQEAEGIEVLTFTYRDTLQLDFYSRNHSNDGERPLIILMHGGGFASGKRDNPKERQFCTALANKGIAVASISYRLTRQKDSFGCDCDSKSKVETFVQATEDLMDAIHFLSGKESLYFDRERMVAAGSSAGAETVLHAAFMLMDYRFRHIRPYRLAGLISMSGAMLNKGYISPENAIPALLIHGSNDELVPYESDAHHFCDADTPGYLILDGAKTIAQRLHDLQSPYILVTDPGADHGVAGRSLGQTDLIARFVEELVMERKFVQKELTWTDPETTTPSANEP